MQSENNPEQAVGEDVTKVRFISVMSLLTAMLAQRLSPMMRRHNWLKTSRSSKR